MSLGADWHDPDIRNAELTGGQCSMFVGNWLLGRWQCEAPSTHKVVGGCVHEHGREWHTCAAHAEPCDLFCNVCTDSAEPHECLLRLVVTELAPTP